MTTETRSILTTLESAGVRFEVSGGDLKYTAPAGALTADLSNLLRRLSAVKADVIAFLAGAVEPAPAPLRLVEPVKAPYGSINNPRGVLGREPSHCPFIDCESRLTARSCYLHCPSCGEWFTYKGDT